MTFEISLLITPFTKLLRHLKMSPNYQVAKVEETKRLDIRELKKSNLFVEGATGELTWGGNRHEYVDFQIDKQKLILQGNALKEKSRITIEHQNRGLRGVRAWLLCPYCEHRCEVIYFIRQQPLCWRCARVSHEARNESVLERMVRKYNKLQSQLHDGGLPHWSEATYLKRKNEFNSLNTRLYNHYSSRYG